MLPDVALLEIFGFYMDEERIEAWHTLVHVCQTWRIIVLGSPRRLGLRLYCGASTPVREMLDVWPLLPIVMMVHRDEKWCDNIVATLEHSDRICEIDFKSYSSWKMEKLLAAMRQPFPSLTRLKLRSRSKPAPVDPDLFLGGSAPHLQSLCLERIPFPGLPKLLVSAPRLVDLSLREVFDFGYITPGAIVAGLSILTRLESLNIGFKYPQHRTDWKNRRLPLPTRALLPVLTKLHFEGDCEYLEDLVAQIDAPFLYELSMAFFPQPIFDAPQLAHFLNRTPNFKAQDEAHVVSMYGAIRVTLPQTFGGRLRLGILSNWQLSSLAQLCNSSLPQDFIPAVEHLYFLDTGLSLLLRQDNAGNSQWVELLHLFPTVKSLYISQSLTRRFALVLQGLARERVMEVLPALQTLFFEDSLPLGPDQEAIGQFIAARQLSSHLIAVSCWERK